MNNQGRNRSSWLSYWFMQFWQLARVLVIATRKDVAYGLVVIWALLGIATKQRGTQNIAATTEIGAACILIAFGYKNSLLKIETNRPVSARIGIVLLYKYSTRSFMSGEG